jgi:hypothetical protein
MKAREFVGALYTLSLIACAPGTPQSANTTMSTPASTAAVSPGQVPIPKTAADVTAPASGVLMDAKYAKAIGRVVYIWGWPMSIC